MTAISHTDQLGREIRILEHPKSIVSVVPSQTELLAYLGLGGRINGITKFCIHPPEIFKSKARVGGTKKLDIEKILALKPDLVLANKEENTKEDLEKLMRHVPVWISDIRDLPTALDMITKVGQLTGTSAEAIALAGSITSQFDKLTDHPQPTHPIKVVYLIWKSPFITIGNDTFIHDMLSRCGLHNCFTHASRYPQTTADEINAMAPQYLLLSSEPYPFKHKHINNFQKIFPHSKIIMVDGEMFSWYGSRLLKALQYFQSLQSQFANGFHEIG